MPDDTAIAARDDRSTVLSPVDILFASAQGRHLVVPTARRVDAFFEIVHQLAEAEVTIEINAEGRRHVPQLEREGRIAQRELQHVEEWKEMLDAAYIRKAQELGELHWLNGDGQWQDLAEVLIEAMPEEQQRRSSGRARQVARFIQEGVPAMKEVGVSPALIEQAYQAERPSILSEVSGAVNNVLKRGLTEDQERIEFEIILTKAAQAPSLRDMRRFVQERYHPDKQPERAIYTKEIVGGRARIAIEGSLEVCNIILNRGDEKLQEAPGSLFLSPSPALVQAALGLNQVFEDTGEMVVWDANGQTLMRQAITCNPWRAICLDALEKRDGEWVSIEDIRAITNISPNDIRHAMGEICLYVRDGWNTWAIRHPKEELWQLNQ